MPVVNTPTQPQQPVPVTAQPQQNAVGYVTGAINNVLHPNTNAQPQQQVAPGTQATTGNAAAQPQAQPAPVTNDGYTFTQQQIENDPIQRNKDGEQIDAGGFVPHASKDSDYPELSDYERWRWDRAEKNWDDKQQAEALKIAEGRKNGVYIIGDGKKVVAGAPNQAPAQGEGLQNTPPEVPLAEGYEDIKRYMEEMNPRKTKEELEKEEKRAKQKRMWGAISDGLSALSNLYFAGKGAPIEYNPAVTFSGKARERYDALRKQYEEENNSYLNMYMRMLQRQNEAERVKELSRHNTANEDRLKAKDDELAKYRSEQVAIKKQLAEAEKDLKKALEEKAHSDAELKRIQGQRISTGKSGGSSGGKSSGSTGKRNTNKRTRSGGGGTSKASGGGSTTGSGRYDRRMKK